MRGVFSMSIFKSPRDCPYCGSDQVVRLTTKIKPPLHLMLPSGEIVHHHTVPKEENMGSEDILDIAHCKVCFRMIKTK